MSHIALNFKKVGLLIIILLAIKQSIFCENIAKAAFRGNKKYSNKELHDVISKPWNEYIKIKKRSYADDAAYKLFLFYRGKGYSFASVDYELVQSQVIFFIKEYQQVIVSQIDIVSNNPGKKTLSYPKKRLEKFLTKPAMLEKHYFMKQQILQDVSAIGAFYVNEGYLLQTSEVKYDFQPAFPLSKSVKISIVINEGPRFYLDQIEFEGNKKFTSAALIKSLKFKYGKVFNTKLRQDITINLRDFYKENGYAQVKVSSKIIDLKRDPASFKQKRKIIFIIKEGNVYYINNISLKGLELTRDYVVKRQLDIKKGDRYNIIKIRSSKKNVHKTGLFQWSEIEEKVAGTNKIDLIVSCKERKNKIVTFNLGYGTTYGAVAGIDFEHINIFGTGRHFLASIESTLASAELSKTEMKLELLEPQLFGSRTWSSGVNVFILSEETPSFTVFDYGGGISFKKKFSKILSGNFGTGLLWSDVQEIEDSITEDQEGQTFFLTLNEKLTLNLRDDDGYPTAGSYHSIEFEESLTAIGSDIDYFKFYGHSAWYFNLIGRCVLSVAIRGGVIIPFGDSDEIPIQKRFFSGGATTIRSFQEKELPPLDEEDNPVGGEGIFLLSTELRIPIYGNLGISAFVDSGQIITEVRKLKDYRISDLSYAVGFSLWYSTPIGPIRFDMGLNPKRGENELTGTRDPLFAWFISIGFSY